MLGYRTQNSRMHLHETVDVQVDFNHVIKTSSDIIVLAPPRNISPLPHAHAASLFPSLTSFYSID